MVEGVGIDDALAKGGQGHDRLEDAAWRIDAARRAVHERPRGVGEQPPPRRARQTRHERHQVVARRRRRHEQVAVRAVEDDGRAAVFSERGLRGRLQIGVDRQHDVAPRHGRLARDHLVLVAHGVDADEVAAAAARQLRVAGQFDAIATRQVWQVEVVGLVLLGKPLLLGRLARLARADVADEVAGEVAAGVEALGLHLDLGAGQRSGPLREPGHLPLVEPLEREQRDRAPAVQVAPDAVAVDFARLAHDRRDLVEQGVHAVDGVRPGAGLAQLLDVEGDAIRRPVVGEDRAVAVEDAAARGGLADAPEAGGVLGVRIQAGVLHLDAVEAREQMEDADKHQGAEDCEPQPLRVKSRASCTCRLHSRSPRCRMKHPNGAPARPRRPRRRRRPPRPGRRAPP